MSTPAETHQGQAPSHETEDERKSPAPKFPAIGKILSPAITGTFKESGWSSLSAVGQYIVKNDASFDPRNYGFARLSELVRTLPYVEVKDVPDVTNFLHLGSG